MLQCFSNFNGPSSHQGISLTPEFSSGRSREGRRASVSEELQAMLAQRIPRGLHSRRGCLGPALSLWGWGSGFSPVKHSSKPVIKLVIALVRKPSLSRVGGE